jgi:hypothetical protein
MSELYDPAYINYMAWGEAGDTIAEGFIKRDPVSPPYLTTSTPPFVSSPPYFPPTPSIVPSFTSPVAPTPSPISPLSAASFSSSLSSVSASAWKGLNVKAFLESIPSTSRFDLPGEIVTPSLARDRPPVHLREPSVESEPIVAMAISPPTIKRYKAPRNAAEELEMLNEVKRLEKKLANIVHEPIGITHDEDWIMELGKVTSMEKESVFRVIAHDRVKFGKKKAIVFTCLTIVGEHSRAWVIKMLATEMSKERYPKAYAEKKEYYRKLKKNGKRI